MVAVATVAAAWAGCGGDDNNSSSGNNQGGDNTSATATGTGTATGTATGTGTGTGPGPVTSSSSGGNLPDCKDALVDDFNLLEECETCLADSCCTEVSECAAADNCSVCITGAEECSEDAGDAAMTLVGCAQDNCEAECFDAPPPPPPPMFTVDCNAPADSPSMGACVPVMPNGQFECNAVTNAPCNTAGGEACDVNGMGVQCWPPPNTKKLCEPCSNQSFCMGGFTCVPDADGMNKCAKYCCTDADCSGKCETSVFGFPFGICVEGGAGGAGGGGGMGGMGGGGGMGGAGGGMGGGGMGGAGGGMGGAGGGMGGAGMGGAGGAGGN